MIRTLVIAVLFINVVAVFATESTPFVAASKVNNPENLEPTCPAVVDSNVRSPKGYEASGSPEPTKGTSAVTQ